MQTNMLGSLKREGGWGGQENTEINQDEVKVGVRVMKVLTDG